MNGFLTRGQKADGINSNKRESEMDLGGHGIKKNVVAVRGETE